LQPAAGVQRRERDRLVLPQQHVVLEVEAVLGVEVDLSDRDELALDLAGAAGEPELGHVAQPGCLTPAGIADLVSLVERSPARLAAPGTRLVLGLAPLALNHFHARKIAGQGRCTTPYMAIAGGGIVSAMALLGREFIAVPDDRKGQIVYKW